MSGTEAQPARSREGSVSVWERWADHPNNIAHAPPKRLGLIKHRPPTGAAFLEAWPVTDPSDQSPLERARRFRELAGQASREAGRTSDASIREGYRLLEMGWLQLAADIEAALKREGPPDKADKVAALRPPSNKKQ